MLLFSREKQDREELRQHATAANLIFSSLWFKWSQSTQHNGARERWDKRRADPRPHITHALYCYKPGTTCSLDLKKRGMEPKWKCGRVEGGISSAPLSFPPHFCYITLFCFETRYQKEQWWRWASLLPVSGGNHLLNLMDRPAKGSYSLWPSPCFCAF